MGAWEGQRGFKVWLAGPQVGRWDGAWGSTETAWERGSGGLGGAACGGHSLRGRRWGAGSDGDCTLQAGVMGQWEPRAWG